MFSPDLFSNPIAKYEECFENESSIAVDIIHNYYQCINFKDFKILKLNGIEINSKNFYLKGQKKSFILKKLNKGENLNLVNKQLYLTNWLSTQKIPIPKVIKPDNSISQFVKYNDDKYYLMEFIDGLYFEGFEKSLTNSVQVILDLFNLLELAPNDFKVKDEQKFDYCFSSLRKIIEEAESLKDEWEGIFESDHTLLDSSWKKIRTTFDLLSKREVDFNLSRKGLCHIDLHPHNILMQNDKILGILDFSSFLKGSINTSLSFGFFKLARQAAVYGKINTNIESVFPKINEAFELVKKQEYLDNPKDMLFYSQIEIIRRLLLIVDLNINYNNKEWNKILPVQISSLYESEFLFNNFMK